jgi:hypothetical protein
MMIFGKTLALFWGLTLGVLSTSVYASHDGQVKLLSAFSHKDSAYGRTHLKLRYDILVRSGSPILNPAQRSVYIRHETQNGEWVDIPAFFQKALETGWERWYVDISDANYPLPPGDSTESYTNTWVNLADEFVVKYVLHNHDRRLVFWDNNHGQNYRLADGPILGQDVQLHLAQARYDAVDQVVRGQVYVRNIDYQKTVRVVYTTDDWQTEKVSLAAYQEYQCFAKSCIQYPNEQGFELWTFEIPIDNPEDVSTVTFAIGYQVRGLEFWDHNEGVNYRVAVKQNQRP